MEKPKVITHSPLFKPKQRFEEKNNISAKKDIPHLQ